MNISVSLPAVQAYTTIWASAPGQEHGVFLEY